MILTLAAMADCELAPSMDAPFLVPPPPASQTQLLVVLHAEPDNLPWVDGMLTSLTDHGLQGALSVPLSAPSKELAALMVRAVEGGHDLVAQVGAEDVVPHPEAGPPRLRKKLRPLHKVAGRVRVAETPLGNKTSEMVMHRVGLRALLETNGPPSSVPRKQLHMDGQPDSGVIFPSGPYAGDCGTSSLAVPFSPAAADRVTQALHGARTASFGIVRTTLVPSQADEVEVFSRWLDTIVVPSGVTVQGPQAARELARSEVKDPAPRQDATGGRLVTVAELMALADRMNATRQVSADPSLSAPLALQGMLRILTGDVEGEMVRLQPLAPPGQRGPAVPVRATRAEVVALAKRLLADLPAILPAALPLGGASVAIPELTLAVAAALQGDDPIEVAPL